MQAVALPFLATALKFLSTALRFLLLTCRASQFVVKAADFGISVDLDEAELEHDAEAELRSTVCCFEVIEEHKRATQVSLFDEPPCRVRYYRTSYGCALKTGRMGHWGIVFLRCRLLARELRGSRLEVIVVFHLDYQGVPVLL